MTAKKSAARKALAGTARRDRAPRMNASPEPATPPAAAETAPLHLSAGARAEWEKLAPQARALRTLTVTDGRAFELLCETLATGETARKVVETEGFTVATADGGKKPHPAVRIMEAAGNRAAALLTAFGLTPRGRQSLDLLPAAPPLPEPGQPGAPIDDFDAFLASKPGVR